MASENESEYSELENKHPVDVEAAPDVTANVIPETSRKKYETAYKSFMDWRTEKKITSLAENVLSAYFGELSKRYNSGTLWTIYSMLKTTLSSYNNVDIAKYTKLKAFLKRKASGYIAKKAKTFTTQEINKFISEAPDKQYLLTKAALIMGITGACRRHELYGMKTTHLTDLGTAMLVSVPDTKTNIVRNFTVTNNYYEIIKQYANLRPPNANDPSFFLNYQRGKCTIQKVGINKFGAMGKQIARYLQLPTPELYTGHCFRRSSATILIGANEDGTSLKKTRQLEINNCGRKLRRHFAKYKYNIPNEIQTLMETHETSTSENSCQNEEEGLNEEKSMNEEKVNVTMPSNLVFNNCTVTINIVHHNSHNKD